MSAPRATPSRVLRPLSRRAVLRGAGGAAVGLPWLAAMAPRRASAQALPKRFVVFYFSNGVNPASWTPTGTTAAPILNATMAPLQSLLPKTVILSGINMQTARDNGGNGHNVGITNMLTARKFLKEKDTEFGAIGWGADLTIDQAIAAVIGKTTKFASLQFGVQSFKSYGANAYSYISYAGPQKPIPSEDDPRKLWDRVFAGFDPTAPSLERTRNAKRKSVLDFVAEDLARLQGRLGAADRAKLEAHLTGVRDIELRLGATAQAGAACAPPGRGAVSDFNTNANFPAIGKLQMDLLAMSLACDVTRVATLQWSSAQSGVTHNWVGVTSGHHTVSHLTDQESVDGLQRVQHWYMQQVAYLAGALDRMPESGGSVLDRTVILVCSEVGVGQTHTFLDMPYLLVGGAGGAIKGGRWLRYSKRNHNDLFVALANALDVPMTTFGDPAYSAGALPDIVG